MPTLFKTDRLQVRKLNWNDFDAFLDLHSKENVMNMEAITPMDGLECEVEFNSFIANYNNPNAYINTWAVEEIESGEFVGLCAIIKDGDSGSQIGYRLDDKIWGRGLGTEITCGLINYVFESTSYNTIKADVVRTNMASKKIMSKFMEPIDDAIKEMKDGLVSFQVRKSEWEPSLS